MRARLVGRLQGAAFLLLIKTRVRAKLSCFFFCCFFFLSVLSTLWVDRIDVLWVCGKEPGKLGVTEPYRLLVSQSVLVICGNRI